MSIRGDRCAMGSSMFIAVCAVFPSAAVMADIPAGITVNTQRELFRDSLSAAKFVDFDTEDDAFGGRVSAGPVVRLGLKFSAEGTARQDADIGIFERSLSMLLSNQTVRQVTIDLGQPVNAFGAVFKDPLLLPDVTLTIAGRTLRLADLPDAHLGRPLFAGLLSDRPFHAITIGFPASGPLGNGKSLIMDDFAFGHVPAPGAAGLLACGLLAMRRRR